jgi:hypothetical protein
MVGKYHGDLLSAEEYLAFVIVSVALSVRHDTYHHIRGDKLLTVKRKPVEIPQHHYVLLFHLRHVKGQGLGWDSCHKFAFFKHFDGKDTPFF